MLENRKQPLLTFSAFLKRIAVSFLAAAALVLGSLFIGVLGYRELEGMTWTDAYVNASMILGGMGPVDPVKTEAGKLFAGTYALYSGLLFLVVVAIVLAPVAHRVLHRFHLGGERKE